MQHVARQWRSQHVGTTLMQSACGHNSGAGSMWAQRWCRQHVTQQWCRQHVRTTPAMATPAAAAASWCNLACKQRGATADAKICTASPAGLNWQADAAHQPPRTVHNCGASAGRPPATGATCTCEQMPCHCLAAVQGSWQPCRGPGHPQDASQQQRFSSCPPPLTLPLRHPLPHTCRHL